ncbi:AMP-binding protein [Streptomyces alanosinicus]|uniref:AMP-dependent synthetase/ligase domain-containing protein n=1 Tax=Streptomyces alanosinicus TaxID=68171 RepID=A0A919D5P8_9ACTN|nr:AMP-binding protein [Streptomyces alanosinicus]GHE10279.1 hypothetical protein GCM10010339_65820 [Streptomyces alanosinicus]
MSRPALLDGGPARTPAAATLSEALEQTAARHGRQEIVHLHENGTRTAYTYTQLLDRARRVLAGLRITHTRPSDVLLLDISDPAELICAYWACILGGFIPLPVAATPGLAAQVWSLYGCPRIVTGTGRTPPEDTSAWAGDMAGLLRNTPDARHHRADPGDVAVLLLTSGSTGTPKAVALTHANILARSAATAHTNRLDHRQRTLNWMPLDHVGGLVMFHTRDTCLGAYQVHAPQQWILDQPLRWLEAAHTHRISCTWAPNYAFALVNDAVGHVTGHPWDLSRLTYIMNGGEPVHAEVIHRFQQLLAPHGLPTDAMYPGWGMSETSSGVTDCRFSEHTEGRYVPVGRPQPGTRIRITADDSTVVTQNTVGHVQVSGAAVSHGYYQNPQQNKQSFTSDGWFKTGDLGYISDGVLTVTGRADDQITIAGVTYHGHEIEASVEELGFVHPTYTVATPVTTSAGEGLAVFFHPRTTPTTDDLEALRTLLAERFRITGAHLLAVGKDDIPKTGIGKLRRAPLRERFEASTHPTWTPVLH